MAQDTPSTTGSNTATLDADPNAPTPVFADLPGGFADNKAVADFVGDDGRVDVTKLTQSYVDTKKMVGAGRFTVPESDDDAEGWQKVHEALGRPKTPDDYQVQASDDVPAEVRFSDDDVSFYKGLAHELGLNQSQLVKAMSKIEGRSTEKFNAFAESQKTEVAGAVDRLKIQYGDAFDRNVELAQKAVEVFGGQELKDFMNESGFGNDPRFIKAFVAAGKALGEDRILSTGQKGLDTRTPEEANSEMAAVQQDDKFMAALKDDMNPGHGEAVKKWNMLIQQANPSRKATVL